MDINTELMGCNMTSNTIDVEQNAINSYTKTKLLSFLTENEIKICDRLKKVPYYQFYYDVMYDYEFIKIGQMRDNVIENTEIKHKKYVLCKYIRYKGMGFNDFFIVLPTPKLVIYHALDSYSHLLISLLNLNQAGVCYYRLSPDCLFFDETYKPKIQHFEQSILDANESFTTTITKNKPLEVYAMRYLIENKMETMTELALNTICDDYISNLMVLNLFSQSYKDLHRNECFKFLNSYLDKESSFIINDLMKYIETWDNYSLSLLYIRLIGSIAGVFALKGTIMNKLIAILSRNIDPDPTKRASLQNTILYYKSLKKDFAFIDQIPNDKIDKLREILI